jgi:hypothetical protein
MRWTTRSLSAVSAQYLAPRFAFTFGGRRDSIPSAPRQRLATIVLSSFVRSLGRLPTLTIFRVHPWYLSRSRAVPHFSFSETFDVTTPVSAWAALSRSVLRGARH